MIAGAAAEGPIVVVDAGGSFVKPGASDPQQLGKAGVIAQAMKLGGIDALAIAPSDWALGAEALRALVAERDLPVVAANLSCGGERPFPGTRVIERGGRRIAIIGVTDGVVPGCEVEPLRPALARELAAAADADVRVVLLPVEGHVSRKVLDPPIGADLVLDLQTSRLGVDAEVIGGALMLGSGPRGQRVGLASLTWRSGGGWVSDVDRSGPEIERKERMIDSLRQRLTSAEGAARVRVEQQLARVREELDAAVRARDERLASGGSANLVSDRLVELDTSVADHEATAAVVKAFLGELAKAAPPPTGPRVGPPGGPWQGADVCASCHPAEAAQWATTPHARAWASLVDDGHAGDDDCFACHATGAKRIGGPQLAAQVGGLVDVQCEACHGPAQEHLADPQGIRPERSPGEAVCRKCHDGERDGGRFDPGVYLPQVRHLPPP